MNNTPNDIKSAYDAFRNDFESYYSELYGALTFDPKQPLDMLRYMGTFAGFCDRVDEAKYLLFEEFQKFATEYYHHFKNAPEKEQQTQCTGESAAMRADDDLISYVQAAESVEEFWEDLIRESANVAYLWMTATPHGKNHFSEQMRKINDLMRRWEEMNRQLHQELEEQDDF
jgi:hypothetical protein